MHKKKTPYLKESPSLKRARKAGEEAAEVAPAARGAGVDRVGPRVGADAAARGVVADPVAAEADADRADPGVAVKMGGPAGLNRTPLPRRLRKELSQPLELC